MSIPNLIFYLTSISTALTILFGTILEEARFRKHRKLMLLSSDRFSHIR